MLQFTRLWLIKRSEHVRHWRSGLIHETVSLGLKLQEGVHSRVIFRLIEVLNYFNCRETRIARIVVNHVHAMRYIHSSRAIHSNLKPGHIPFDWDRNLHVGNFDHSISPDRLVIPFVIDFQGK
jgi:hypothetical protein